MKSLSIKRSEPYSMYLGRFKILDKSVINFWQHFNLTVFSMRFLSPSLDRGAVR